MGDFRYKILTDDEIYQVHINLIIVLIVENIEDFLVI